MTEQPGTSGANRFPNAHCTGASPAVAIGSVALQLVCVALLLIAGCSRQEDTGESMSSAWFEECAQACGIDFRHVSGHVERHLMPEILGSGAALADFDGDGDLDAYIVQSGSLQPQAGAAVNADIGNRLYLNRGNGTFDEAPLAHGAADAGYGMGVAAADYDNDGDVDIYVTNVGSNVLLRNDGQGHFEDVAVAAGVDDAGWGTAATFLDLDADGDLDLFLVNYITWNPAIESECGTTYCSPQFYDAPAPDHLYRNNGDGTFTDVSAAAGLTLAFGSGLGVVGADFDQDGRIDLFVANDGMFNQLWLNQGNLHFAEEAMLKGVAVDEHGSAKAGMGVAAADVDDDGDVDLLVVNLAEQTDSFYRNEGSYFVDTTWESGLSAVSRKYTRFGVVLADFNNDGLLDLYEANGRIVPGEGSEGDVFAEPNILYRGLAEGRFEEVQPSGGTALPLRHTSRGLAVGDVDDDGGLDLLVVNRDGPVYLLKNRVADRGNWLRFRVLVRSGRDAYGATVAATIGTKRVQRDVQVTASYLASNDPRVHFGLGSETRARDITVRWADGVTEKFGDFEAGQIIELRRSAGNPSGGR